MREILTLGPDSAHVPLQTVKTYRKGERIICKDDVGTSVVCYLLPLQCACLIPIALVSSLIKEHVFLLRVRCGVQYFVDVGRVQAVLSNRVLSEMTSGACFGEMAFVMSCKKVLRMHGFQADMAIRACDCKAVDVVRVVSLPLSLSFLPPNTLPPSLPHSRTHALPPPLPHSFTPSLLHSLPQTVSHLHALTLSLSHTRSNRSNSQCGISCRFFRPTKNRSCSTHYSGFHPQHALRLACSFPNALTNFEIERPL